MVVMAVYLPLKLQPHHESRGLLFSEFLWDSLPTGAILLQYTTYPIVLGVQQLEHLPSMQLHAKGFVSLGPDLGKKDKSKDSQVNIYIHFFYILIHPLPSRQHHLVVPRSIVRSLDSSLQLLIAV